MSIRKIGAVVGGLIAGMLVIYLFEALGHHLFPVDQEKARNVQSIQQLMDLIPPGALALVLVAYAFGAFVSGVVSTLIMRRETIRQAMTCGIILTVLGILNLLMIPHPIWFTVVNVVIYIPLAWLGGKLVFKPGVTEDGTL